MTRRFPPGCDCAPAGASPGPPQITGDQSKESLCQGGTSYIEANGCSNPPPPARGSSPAPSDPPGSGAHRICNYYGCASAAYWRHHPDNPAAHKPAPVTTRCFVSPRGSYCTPDTSGGSEFWNWFKNHWQDIAQAFIAAAGSLCDSGLAEEGLGELCTAAQDDADEELGATCGESFTASTKVVLASGAAIPIADLKPGDKVLATNVKTGKTQAETVSAVLVHYDHDLYNLTVRAGPRTSVIRTTASHLFWDTTTHRWVKAAALHPGDHLRTPDGTTATVTGGYTPRQAAGWMWDLTIPGDHDFYIDTASPILVHNCPPDGTGSGSPTVAQVLKTKLGSITRAPLPPGSPSWSEIGNMTLDEVRAAARANKPGFRTILKLLTDSRFNKR